MIYNPRVGQLVRRSRHWGYQNQDRSLASSGVYGEPTLGQISFIEGKIEEDNVFDPEPPPELRLEGGYWIRVIWEAHDYYGNKRSNVYPPWALDLVTNLKDLVTNPTEIKEFEEV